MHHHQGDGGRRRECTTLFYYRSSNTNHTLVCVSVRVGKQRVNDVGSVYSSILPNQHHLHINFETHKKVYIFSYIYIQIPYCTPHEDYARHGILKIYITKCPTTAINCSYSSSNNSEILVRSFDYGEEKECAPSYTVTAPIDSMKRPHSELSTHNEEGEEEHPRCENPEETITPTDSSRTSSNLPTGTTTPTDEDVVSLPPPQRTPSPPSLPPSPPPPTILESQQHPKILGFHVFSSKRNLKRQRSMSSISTTATTTIAASNNLDHTEHSTTDTPIAITNDSTTTNNNNTASSSSSSTMDWLLPISVLQRIYEHIPLPPIQPVTDEELVRYTMVSVNAIRNGDVALLRQILRQKQHPPPLSSSSSFRSHHHDGHQNSDTTTTTTLSWFDGRNRNGESLLHLACRRSTVDVVQFLIHEAQVNMTMTDLYGRTCLHDICWRPRVEEAIPIFHVVRQHYMSTLQQKRMEEQQERWSTNNNNNSNHESNSTTSTPSSSLVQWLSMWPFQPDIRGHVCFDYCRQEHWYEWNTYLQEQIQKDMAVNMETTTHVPPVTETTIATTTLEEAADVTHEEKSSLWCTIG